MPGWRISWNVSDISSRPLLSNLHSNITFVEQEIPGTMQWIYGYHRFKNGTLIIPKKVAHWAQTPKKSLLPHASAYTLASTSRTGEWDQIIQSYSSSRLSKCYRTKRIKFIHQLLLFQWSCTGERAFFLGQCVSHDDLRVARQSVTTSPVPFLYGRFKMPHLKQDIQYILWYVFSLYHIWMKSMLKWQLFIFLSLKTELIVFH